MAAGKNRRQRHAEGGGQMQQRGIDTEYELGPCNQAGDGIQRRPFRNALTAEGRGDALAPAARSLAVKVYSPRRLRHKSLLAQGRMKLG